MYFANMFCYGHDTDIVGITGIRGCMGLVYRGAGAMYAVHIPPNSADDNKAGGIAFANHVLANQHNVGKGIGHLFAFVNGSNRDSAEDEARAVKKLLNNTPTALYRIMKHLGPNSGTPSADSVAIMVEPVHASADNPSGTAIWYKRNDDITWVAGGTAESGQYKVRPAYQGNDVPSDLNAHWWRMDETNSTHKKI